MAGSQKTFVEQAKTVAGRFRCAGAGTVTPTGTVFSATDLSTGSEVLLKLVPAEVLPNGPMADRAMRELKQLAKITSDRILRVIDHGRAEGQLYIALEKTGEISLEELVSTQGPLAFERARGIVSQAGEALLEAQKVGVIHRDIAPRNILVGPGDRVKVKDFGLAEPIDDRVFGAPAYLSPEQAEAKPVDQRSNIYSLGAVLYYALTGSPPFTGEVASVVQQHLQAVPKPPSSLRREISGEVDRLVLKALEKSGGRRPLTLRQFLNEMESGDQPRAAATSEQPGGEIGRSPTMVASAPNLGAPPPRVARPLASTVMGLPSPVAGVTVAKSPPTVDAPQKTKMIEAPGETRKPAAQGATTAETPAAIHPSGMRPTSPASEPAKTAVPPSGPRTVVSPAAAPPTDPVVKSGPVAPPSAPAPARAPAAPAQAPGPASAQASKKAFRETAWFKKGEIEEELAKAQAVAATRDPLAPSGGTGQHPALDENQIDVSAQDRARLSLKTGHTQVMSAVKPEHAVLPGERMDEVEMLAEIDSSRRWLLLAAGVVAVVAVIVTLYLLLHKSAPTADSRPPPAPPPKAAAAAPRTTERPTPTAIAAAPPSNPRPSSIPSDAARLMEQAEAETKKQNLGTAVDFLLKAKAAGATEAEWRMLDRKLTRALEARAARARKRRNPAAEKQARRELGRLKLSRRPPRQP